MFRKLSTTETIATVIASGALAATALILSLKLTLTPSYSDFIVGNITWQGQTKLQDLIAAPVFVIVLFLGYLFLSWLINGLSKKFGKPCSEELVIQLFWWSVPAATAVAGLILGSSADWKLFQLSSVGLVVVGASSSYNWWRGKLPNPSTVGFALFAVILVALIPFEIAIALGRTQAEWTGDVITSRYIKTAAYILAAVGVGAACVLSFQAPERLFRWMPKLLLIGQFGLPLLFLTLYPARLVTPDGGITKYTTTVGLKILVIVLLVWGIIDVIRRYRKSRSSLAKDWGSLLSPIALFGLLVAVRLGNTVSPYISPDDYHYGEQLLGWWSYLQGGMLPYVDYIPPHGLIGDDLTGFLSFFLYDGTAASIPDARRISIALLALLSYYSIYRFSRSLGLSFISILFLVFIGPVGFTWLYLTPFFCLWFSNSLSNNPSRWLSIWLLTTPIVILGVPAQGLVAVAASGVIALWCVWNSWVKRKEVRWWEIGISMIILLVFALTTRLVPMLSGAIGYVLDNGPINQIAYGVPWKLSWDAGAKHGLIFEVVRMSWIAIPFASLFVIFTSRKERAIRHATLLPAIVVLLFAFVLVPYSMGRIDPGSISRSGLLAIFGWTVLVPIIVWPLIERSSKVGLILFIAVMSVTLSGPLSLSSLGSAVSARVAIGHLKDGKSAGLANLGVATVDHEHWDRLTRLNTLINEKLSPGETYLDLTNRNAQYFYLNRLPAIAVTAPYNMVPLSEQQHAVVHLSSNLPRLALLEASNIVHDGGGLALRTHLLYRFVLDHYVPALENGFIIGQRKQSNYDDSKQVVQVPIRDLSDANWDRGVNRVEAALVLSSGSLLLSHLRIGDEVVLENGEHRHITRIWREGDAIWLDGKVLDPEKTVAPNIVTANIDQKEWRLSLFEKAFAVPHLAKIPVSWGRSEASLLKRMKLVKKLDPVLTSTLDLALENGTYKVSGNDPQMVFDISGLDISGKDAGLLRFEFSCLNKKFEPEIQVFYWGDDQPGPTEVASFRFTADDGVLIVPLDAYPRWLTISKVSGLRLDLANANACATIRISNVELYQRRSVTVP